MAITWEDDFRDGTKISSSSRIIRSSDAGIVEADPIAVSSDMSTNAIINTFFNDQTIPGGWTAARSFPTRGVEGRFALGISYNGLGDCNLWHHNIVGADVLGGWNNAKQSIYVYVDNNIRSVNSITEFLMRLTAPSDPTFAESIVYGIKIDPNVDANNILCLENPHKAAVLGGTWVSTGITIPTSDTWMKMTVEVSDNVLYYRIEKVDGDEETSSTTPLIESYRAGAYLELNFTRNAAGASNVFFDLCEIRSHLVQENNSTTWPEHQHEFDTIDVEPSGWLNWRKVTLDKTSETITDEKFITCSIYDTDAGTVIPGFDDIIDDEINIRDITITKIFLRIKFWSNRSYDSPILTNLKIIYDGNASGDVTLAVTANSFNDDIVTPIVTKTGYNIRFDATAATSPDPDVEVTHYWFDFGDGLNSGWITSNVVNHIYSSHSQNVSESGVDLEWNARIKVKYSNEEVSGWSNLIDVNVSNEAPEARMWVRPIVSRMGGSGVSEYIYFFGSDSFDIDDNGSISPSGGYLFDFGDGTPQVWQDNSYTTHRYSDAGTYITGITVKDDLGLESEKLLSKVIIKPPLTSVLLVFHRRPSQIDTSYSSDYQITKTIAGGFPDVEPLTARNRTVKITGNARLGETDIILLQNYVENQTLVKLQYIDMTGAIRLFTGYIKTFNISRRGGFIDDVPYTADLQYVDGVDTDDSDLILTTYLRYIQSGSLPTPSSAYKDVYLHLLGGSGIRDKVYFCVKGEDGNYRWVEISAGEVG